MKTTIVMAMMSMLLASAAFIAAGAGFGNVDIVGSNLNNIKIFSSDSGLGDMEKHLDVVGSKLENMNISSDNINLWDAEVVGSSMKNVEILPAQVQGSNPMCEKVRHDPDTICFWDSACMDYSHVVPHVSYSNAHLGVDAWYGEYWFNDQIYTPKWPQNY